MVSRNARVIVIQARGGVGKTTLARKYLQQEFSSFIEFPIAKETKDIASIEVLIEEKLRQLGEEPGREFLVSLDRLKRKLQAERIGILIDNLEPALDSASKFIEAHRRYVELLRVLSDSTVKSITLITSRERLRESDITVQHYPLKSLNVKAWEQFFQGRGINAETPALVALHNAYGGNAKAMDIISGAALEDFSGDVEVYWQANQNDLFVERDLEDLVKKQFDRLQQLDLNAYNLLCRMGCYRYQDVPTVPIEGLFCLLWDVSENRHLRVIKSLQDRSLVDFEDREFWLHPVIRSEAVGRLRSNAESEIANQRAAEFWAESVESVESIQDALEAFEAYYHFIENNDFEQAVNTILKERSNKWQSNEWLGHALFRLGLFQILPSKLSAVINHLSSGNALSGIYHFLGDTYAINGHVQDAIKAFKESEKIASKFDINYRKIVAWQNIGHCNLDLWELEEAEIYFEKVIIHAQNTSLHSFAINSWFLLAYLNSCRLCEQSKQKALDFSQRVIQTYEDSTEVKLLSAWGKGQSLVFLGLTYKNLGEIQESLYFYTKAIKFAEESSYTLVKANALVGLSEIYRIKREYETALSYNAHGIELLTKIGAITDVAEAYYQLGLTYKMIGEFDKSNKHFQESISIFTKMEAPKQVKRVRQSMQN
ncbi:MAG: hypothetical protein HC899_31505 [Leptolyngbyaceae cyanobacterium SM1_4_3]|nr:hypothetical protein [Leptolyngbyaceae cyanobacterium SM1_4_3]NJN90599.1 hypothetical protein [Leptolyngbyaceae cyanobacterium SL_5_14]